MAFAVIRVPLKPRKFQLSTHRIGSVNARVVRGRDFLVCMAFLGPQGTDEFHPRLFLYCIVQIYFKMRNLFSLTIIAATMAMSLAGCEKNETFTVDSRTPQPVSFQQRVLTVTPGANLPANAEAVDLGLSVKWANMNLGATSEKQLGDLYAWGEITPSKNYGWFNYEHNDFHANDEKTLYLTKYCFDKYGEKQDIKQGGINLDKNDDAAYVQWGPDWRMPTYAETQELVSKCKFEFDEATKLVTVTGPNGNSIKISQSSIAVGVSTSIFSEEQGPAVTPGFWSSTLDTYNSPDAAYFRIKVEKKDGKWVVTPSALPRQNRCYGLPIRPVKAK